MPRWLVAHHHCTFLLGLAISTAVLPPTTTPFVSPPVLHSALSSPLPVFSHFLFIFNYSIILPTKPSPETNQHLCRKRPTMSRSFLNQSHTRSIAVFLNDIPASIDALPPQHDQDLFGAGGYPIGFPGPAGRSRTKSEMDFLDLVSTHLFGLLAPCNNWLT